MRIEAGHIRSVGSNGRWVNSDQRLSREQVDVLIAVLERNGRCPKCTSAVELNEGGAHLETPDREWAAKCDHVPDVLEGAR